MNRMPWLLLLPVALPLHAATYYVTPAGGAPPTCDGTTALPAPSAHCSWSSPLIALPPPPYGGTWVHGAQCPTWVYQGGICPVTAVTCTIVASVTAPSITCH